MVSGLLIELWQQSAVLLCVHEPLSCFVHLHIYRDLHMMYSCTIHTYVMYIDWNTCIGVRASPNKLTTLMTLQCNENNCCMQCIYISSVRYVSHNYSKAYVRRTSNQVLMSHFSSYPCTAAQNLSAFRAQVPCAPLAF